MIFWEEPVIGGCIVHQHVYTSSAAITSIKSLSIAKNVPYVLIVFLLFNNFFFCCISLLFHFKKKLAASIFSLSLFLSLWNEMPARHGEPEQEQVQLILPTENNIKQCTLREREKEIMLKETLDHVRVARNLIDTKE